MDRQWHQYLNIQIMVAVEIAPSPWCHVGTLPLDELVDWQTLKLISTGCQISDQFHFEAHLLFGSESSPQYEFFDLIGHWISFIPPQRHPPAW